METLKRFSSSLSSQIKELGVKVSSKDVWGRGATNGSLDRDSGESFSNRVLSTAVAGEVLFETSGLFHDFILQIEDAAIHLLLEHLSPEDLPQAASAFADRVKVFGGSHHADDVYCASQLGAIRRGIRTMASEDPSRLREHLEEIFAAISLSADKKISLMSEPFLRALAHTMSGPESAEKRISYEMLYDESFASVLHLRIPLLTMTDDKKPLKTSRKTKLRNAVVSVLVSKAGSDQVHGVYTMVPNAISSASPVYSNPDGYMISRLQKRISSSNDAKAMSPGSPSGVNGDLSDESTSDEASSADSARTPDFVLYQWSLSNPSVSSCYYSCCTVDPSLLPPALGWRPSRLQCQGKAPGPYLTVNSSDCSPSDSDDSEEEDAASELSSGPASTAKENSEKIDRAERRRKKETERKATADNIALPILTIDSFPSLPLASSDTPTSTRNGAPSSSSGSSALNQRILRRSVTPVGETAYISPLRAGKGSNCSEMSPRGSAGGSTGGSPGGDKGLHTPEGLHAEANNAHNGHVGHHDRGEEKETKEMKEKKEKKEKECDDDEDPGGLRALVDRCATAEVLYNSKIDALTKRLAWLGDVTDTDELLSGFAYAAEEAGRDMEIFEDKWSLDRIILRSQLSSIIRPEGSKSLVVRVPGDDEIAQINVAEDLTGGRSSSTSQKEVRKVASLPSMTSSPSLPRTVPDAGDSASHRRSQSQSIYQWNVPTSFISDDDSEEGEVYDLHSGNLSPQRRTPTKTPTPVEERSGNSSGTRTPFHSQTPPKNIQADCTDTQPLTGGSRSPVNKSGGSPVGVGSNSSGTSARDSRLSVGKGTQCLAELLETVSPLEQHFYCYSEVDVIGVELRSSAIGGSSSAEVVDRAHYMIRVFLRDSDSYEPSVEGNQASHTRSVSALEVGVRDGSRDVSITGSRDSNNADDTANPSTAAAPCLVPESHSIASEKEVRRESHTEQRHRSHPGVISPQSYSRQAFTVRRDLTTLSLFHAELSDLLLSHPQHEISPPPFPDPFLIAAVEEGLTASSAAQRASSFTHKIMKTRLEGDAFAYSTSMRAKSPRVKEGLSFPGLDRALDDIQQYLRGVFALVETLDGHVFTQGDESPPSQHINTDLLSQLGMLIGSLLTSTVAKEKQEESKEKMRPMMGSSGDLPSLSSSAAFLHSLSTGGSPKKRNYSYHSKEASEGPSPVLFPRDERGKASGRGACWQPYLRVGLKMRLTFSDDQGGRLSLKSDEELLRFQRSRCMGCGEPLSVQWGFLGLDRNYQPCRYFGGLFCRKWCHADDRRQIPHRLLLYWDHTAHRVSIQAARFLDGLWRRPLMLLNTANPLLYEGVPALRLARIMRGRAMQLIGRVMESESSAERCDVMEVIVNVLGADQVHLCLSKEMYSLSNLVGVQSGEVLASLENLIGVLRDKDRSLGHRLGPS